MRRRYYELREDLIQLKERTLEALSNLQNMDQLNELRVKILGKKGELTQILRGMAQLSAEERPVIGKLANEIKDLLENKFNEKMQVIKQSLKEQKMQQEFIDVTIPTKFSVGSKHPLTLVMDEIRDIFIGLGYEVAEGPEIELDYYNFEALNTPPDHPARRPGHLLHYGKNTFEDPDITGAGKNHGTETTPAENNSARPSVPLRCGGRHTFPHVPSGGGPYRRGRLYHGGSKGNPGEICPRDVRQQS